TEQVGQNSGTFLASFSVSQNGVLVYGSAGTGTDELVWFDRTGKRLGTVGEPGTHFGPSLSPDEKQVSVDRLDPQSRTYDVWLTELARGVSTRFTFQPRDDFAPVWSRDGRRVVFTSNRNGPLEIYSKIASGAGKEELLLNSSNLASALSNAATFPCDWSPDGRYLLYVDQDPKTKADLWLLPDPGNTSGGAKP